MLDPQRAIFNVVAGGVLDLSSDPRRVCKDWVGDEWEVKVFGIRNCTLDRTHNLGFMHVGDVGQLRRDVNLGHIGYQRLVCMSDCRVPIALINTRKDCWDYYNGTCSRWYWHWRWPRSSGSWQSNSQISPRWIRLMKRKSTRFAVGKSGESN